MKIYSSNYRDFWGGHGPPGPSYISVLATIGDHIFKSGHNGSLEDFDIFSKTENSFDRLIHESFSILRNHPSLNSQQSSIPLVLFWFFSPFFYLHFLVLPVSPMVYLSFCPQLHIYKAVLPFLGLFPILIYVHLHLLCNHNSTQSTCWGWTLEG